MSSKETQTTDSLWTNADGVIAHPGSPVGAGGNGRFRSATTLDAHRHSAGCLAHPQAPACRYTTPVFELFAERKKRKSGKGKKVNQTLASSGTDGVDLSFYGSFPSVWDKKSERDILDAVGANDNEADGTVRPKPPGPRAEWSPGSIDLARFAKTGQRSQDPNPEVVADLRALLYMIGKKKPGTVRRVYLFTHAEDGYIGLSGTVTLDSPYFNGKGIDDADLSQAEEGGIVFGREGISEAQRWAEDVTIDRVRSAFQKNAEVVIFACHGGLDKPYLNRISKLLGVKVKGFSKEIRYTLSTDSHHRQITRRTYGIEDDPTPHTNFRELIPDKSSD